MDIYTLAFRDSILEQPNDTDSEPIQNPFTTHSNNDFIIRDDDDTHSEPFHNQSNKKKLHISIDDARIKPFYNRFFKNSSKYNENNNKSFNESEPIRKKRPKYKQMDETSNETKSSTESDSE